MSRNDLVNKNWLANFFRNFRKRTDSPDTYLKLRYLSFLGSILNSGKCFVIDKETQTSQDTLDLVWLHSFISQVSLRFAVCF